MYYAVISKNLSMVRMLEEYNADALNKNKDGICPIDIAITEDMRELKLYFMSLQKYKHFDFEAGTNRT